MVKIKIHPYDYAALDAQKARLYAPKSVDDLIMDREEFLTKQFKR
ncbi:hypothetical protein C900_05382 [Fulvivirga imtechensis AK7]|uniref:Uncharacterized protein n=1 Tax=Fulvivirga imtechensis AK7 TaxID=1237149 RepID=L8JJV0_9BACT|nr:hypothetical protein [Fulvivirga imtechensis]ELR69186.1 hypothetical protein C900_05382 [Fulvivirga imtechensis AK7]